MRVGEVARHIGVSADWLRRQERTGNIVAARRDRNGRRRYDEDTIADGWRCGECLNAVHVALTLADAEA